MVHALETSLEDADEDRFIDDDELGINEGSFLDEEDDYDDEDYGRKKHSSKRRHHTTKSKAKTPLQNPTMAKRRKLNDNSLEHEKIKGTKTSHKEGHHHLNRVNIEMESVTSSDVDEM